MAEKLSVVMARRNIRMAHVVLLVLDASEGVVALDATIAGYAHEEGRALISASTSGTSARRKKAFDGRRSSNSSSWITRPWFVSAKTGAGTTLLFLVMKESTSRLQDALPPAS